MTVELFPTQNSSSQSGSADNAHISSTPPKSEDQSASDGLANAENTEDLFSFTDITDLKIALIEFWQDGVLGMNFLQLLIGIGIFLAFIFLRGIFTHYVLDKLHSWSSRSASRIDDNIIDALKPPVRFIPIILGIYFSFRYVGLNVTLGDVFTQIIKSLFAYTLFWGIYRGLLPLSHGMDKLKKILTPTMVIWLFKTLRMAIIFLGAAVILEIWGIKIGPLLAGLGLFGVAVALGAQDFFKNLIAGVTIIAEKRFQPGNWIFVEGIVEGVVEDVGIRSTQVRRFDKAPVHVPNSQLSDTAIVNFSRMTYRRIYWKIGVVYSTSTDQLKIVRDQILEYIENNDSFQKENVSTFVRIDSFAASSIDILIYCFTKTIVWGEWLEIRENLALKIKEIVEDNAQTSFAFPSQSLYIEQLPDGMTPEIFTPPGGQKTGDQNKQE